MPREKKARDKGPNGVGVPLTINVKRQGRIGLSLMDSQKGGGGGGPSRVESIELSFTRAMNLVSGTSKDDSIPSDGGSSVITVKLPSSFCVGTQTRQKRRPPSIRVLLPNRLPSSNRLIVLYMQ